MRYRKTKIIISILLGLASTKAYTQETTTTSGGNATGSGGSVSYSIGQTVYIPQTGTNGFVLNSVQQPYEISIVVGMPEIKGIQLECSAFPNPTSDFLILKLENYKNDDLTYQVFTYSGILLKSHKLTGNRTSIPMANLNSGIYFIKVCKQNKSIKTFKIIKI